MLTVCKSASVPMVSSSIYIGLLMVTISNLKRSFGTKKKARERARVTLE
jgi:hypothetical protein